MKLRPIVSESLVKHVFILNYARMNNTYRYYRYMLFFQSGTVSSIKQEHFKFIRYMFLLCLLWGILYLYVICGGKIESNQIYFSIPFNS